MKSICQKCKYVTPLGAVKKSIFGDRIWYYCEGCGNKETIKVKPLKFNILREVFE